MRISMRVRPGWVSKGLYLCVLVWATHDNHSQNQGSSISRTHTTILVYARTSHYKFGRVWKRFRDHFIITKSRTITNVMASCGSQQIIISTKNLGVPGLFYFNKEPWCPLGQVYPLVSRLVFARISPWLSAFIGMGSHPCLSDPRGLHLGVLV